MLYPGGWHPHTLPLFGFNLISRLNIVQEVFQNPNMTLWIHQTVALPFLLKGLTWCYNIEPHGSFSNVQSANDATHI